NGALQTYPHASQSALSFQSGMPIVLPANLSSIEFPAYTNQDGTGVAASNYQDGPTGWSIILTGTPHAGDVVEISNAVDTLGDGFKLNAGNAEAFLALRDKAMFDSGTTLSDGFSA